MCKTSIELFYCVCKQCKNRFCAEHFQPDRHQCQEEAKEIRSSADQFRSNTNKQALRDKASAVLK